MFEIKVDDKAVVDKLNQLMQAGQDMSPVMRGIATELLSQTEENFAAQGRPRWLGLSRATLEARVGRAAGKKGRLKDGRVRKSVGGRVSSMILQDTGQLAASITTSHDATSATIGSNKVYAAIHQLGGKAGRGKKVTIPARPYLPITAQGGLQPEAEEGIMDIVNGYLSRIIRE